MKNINTIKILLSHISYFTETRDKLINKWEEEYSQLLHEYELHGMKATEKENELFKNRLKSVSCFIEDLKGFFKPKKVFTTYKFDNGMVCTIGYDGKQIGELQGIYTPELHEKIKLFSDSDTIWNGF